MRRHHVRQYWQQHILWYIPLYEQQMGIASSTVLLLAYCHFKKSCAQENKISPQFHPKCTKSLATLTNAHQQIFQCIVTNEMEKSCDWLLIYHIEVLLWHCSIIIIPFYICCWLLSLWHQSHVDANQENVITYMCQWRSVCCRCIQLSSYTHDNDRCKLQKASFVLIHCLLLCYKQTSYVQQMWSEKILRRVDKCDFFSFTDYHTRW